MTELKDLYDQRSAVWEAQKAINDKAVEENRDLTPEEQEQWDKADVDFQELTDKIEEAKKVEERKAERIKQAEERKEYLEKSQYEPTKPDPEIPTGKRAAKPERRATDEYRDAFRGFLRSGISNGQLEQRDIQSDSDVKGGFVVAPNAFMAELIKDLEDEVFIRRYAKVLPLPNAMAIEVPELANRIGDPTPTAEIGEASRDTTMSFERRMLTPRPWTRYIRVSKTLLRLAAIDLEAEIRGGLAYEFATVEEDKFMNGIGAGGEPLGCMVASDNGIGTGRDVSTGNTTSAIKADNLWECVYTLKAQYRRRARWAFHRDALKMIRKLKTGEGDYIWRAGIADGTPATICGLPYDESEYMPNTFTSGLYVGILADWNYYWIADAMDMAIQVLVELRALNNENVYVARKEFDGRPVHQNGFVRVTLA